MAQMTEPWSKRHKHDFQQCPFSLSNSFAEPLTHQDLIDFTLARGDQALVDEYSNNHNLAYTPNGGSLDLRQAIADLYNSDDFSDATTLCMTPDHILVCAGGQVALQTAAFCLAAPAGGGHSIVFSPGYQSTIESPLHAGGRVTQIARHAENHWKIDLEQVRQAIRPDTKFLILNEPYNPAGTLMTREAQQDLIRLCDEHGIFILCDEIYRYLEHDPNDRLPALCQAYRRGLSAVAVSKPWGGCGITIGWLAFSDFDLRQRLLDVQYFGTACPSRASELQALMVLRASKAILAQRSMPIILRNKELLRKVVEEDYPEFFEWIPPTAGAICFLKFKGPWTSAKLGQELARAGISIKPAYCFTNQVTPEIDYFRVGYGESIMPRALEAFCEFIEQHKNEWRAAMSQN